MALTKDQAALLEAARQYFVGHRGAVGVLIPEGRSKWFLKSGEHGGQGGAQDGGVPRGVPGYAFTSGGPSQFNIATHVEGHAAAIMYQKEYKKAVLLVDRAMCGICSRLLYTALPPGARLLVVSDEEGETFVLSSHA